jgi:hypothetical protein
MEGGCHTVALPPSNFVMEQYVCEVSLSNAFCTKGSPSSFCAANYSRPNACKHRGSFFGGPTFLEITPKFVHELG